MWILYVIIGAILEEKDLACHFSDAYTNTKKNVPMLLPIKFNWSKQ